MISLRSNFLFYVPVFFPSRFFAIQSADVFAPYWADTDTRVQGVYWAVIFAVTLLVYVMLQVWGLSTIKYTHETHKVKLKGSRGSTTL